MAPQDSMPAASGESLPLPNNLHSSSGSGPGSGSTPGFLSMANGLKKRFARDPVQSQSQPHSEPGSAPGATRSSQWWKIHLFRGMVNDLRRRAPYYWSDWRDAWDYRVVPATIYMYFAKYGLPPKLNKRLSHDLHGCLILNPRRMISVSAQPNTDSN